jgi:hypothetical protein
VKRTRLTIEKVTSELPLASHIRAPVNYCSYSMNCLWLLLPPYIELLYMDVKRSRDSIGSIVTGVWAGPSGV